MASGATRRGQSDVSDRAPGTALTTSRKAGPPAASGLRAPCELVGSRPTPSMLANGPLFLLAATCISRRDPQLASALRDGEPMLGVLSFARWPGGA